MTFNPCFPTGNRYRHPLGHVLVHCPEYPGAQSNGYVAEHRLVLERLLGRYLLPGEKVRHRDGDRTNNRPDNLELLPVRSLAERFWSRVQKGDGCWLWQGRRQRQGYGVFTVGRDPRLAHRIAYKLGVGPIPDGQCICHRCDNPPCVNPAHLFAGTQQDNMADMVAKGRSSTKLSAEARIEVRRLQGMGVTQRAIAARFGVHQATVQRAVPVGGPKGERNRRAKLTSNQVRAMRWQALGGEEAAALAKAYGIGKGATWRILTGRAWSHVPWFSPEDLEAALSDDVKPLFPEALR
jgi:hypothetical protein